MKRNTRSSVWFWVLLVLMITIGTSIAIAASTHDSACATPDSPKHWEIFPPRWACERRF